MPTFRTLGGGSSTGPRSGLPAWVSVLLGAVLGAGLGFYLGRATAPGADLQAVPPADLAPASGIPAAPGEAAPAPVADPAPPAAPGPAPAAPTPGATPSGTTRRLAVTLDSSLYQSLSGELPGREADILSAHIGRLLIWWLDARRDVLRGDRLEVAWEPVPGPGEIRVRALRYQSQKLGKTLEAYLFQRPGAAYGRYYDPDGVEIEQRLEPSPLDEYEQVTEVMNLGGRRHRGVDFKVDVGTPVRTPEDAVVSRVNWRTRGNGNCLELVYPRTGATATFLHLDKVLPETRPGRRLKAGTAVALSGNTGRSTAPHLHYELHDRAGRLVNPFDYHTTTRRRLEGAELEAFRGAQAELARGLQGLGGAGLSR